MEKESGPDVRSMPRVRVHPDSYAHCGNSRTPHESAVLPHQPGCLGVYDRLYIPGPRPQSRRRREPGGRLTWRCYDRTMTPSDSILFSGGAPGAEAEFGACAERRGIEEVNFTFDGHAIARSRGVRVLNHEELLAGDVSLAYVGR